MSLTSSSSAGSPVQIISSGEYDEEDEGDVGDGHEDDGDVGDDDEEDGGVGDEDEDDGDEDVEDDHLVPILGAQNKNIESETKQQKN